MFKLGSSLKGHMNVPNVSFDVNAMSWDIGALVMMLRIAIAWVVGVV